MNYRQTLDYLYQRLPMFQRQGTAAYKKDLHNTIVLCNAIGNPHQKIRTIHIAGTNGKGSVSHFLSSVLQEANCKVGLYTSPHLIDFRERIKINGQLIPESEVIEFVEKLRPLIETIEPSFFEVTVVLAFNYFAKQNVDFAVIETGLGGRLDSTNIINPELSVITNISYDHQNLLGNTLPLIAAEKAGIIKFQRPVIVGKRNPVTDRVFIEKASEEKSDIIFAQDESVLQMHNWVNGNLITQYKYKNREIIDLETTLGGLYQLENIATVISAVKKLDEMLPTKNLPLVQGINRVIENTGLRGRWEILHNEPLIIADVAHNEAGIKSAISQIESMQYDQLRIVYGMVRDKDSSKALNSLPKNAIYYFCCPDIPRGLSADELVELAAEYGLSGQSFDTVANAYEKAQADAKKNDFILCLGSLFVIAEILKAI
jgi:dihydrofolate synthase/folylpolyglutamate synthase